MLFIYSSADDDGKINNTDIIKIAAHVKGKNIPRFTRYKSNAPKHFELLRGIIIFRI
jgi:hypothetical protein